MKFFGIEKAGTPSGGKATLERHIRPFVIERQLGETRSSVQELMNPLSTASMQILIAYMTLLFSNDLIRDGAVQAFLVRAEEMQQLGNLRPLLAQRSPSARAVATRLLHAAIHANALNFLSQALKFADVESPSIGKHSLSLLQRALKGNKYEAAQILITAGADVKVGVKARYSKAPCKHGVNRSESFTCNCQIIGAYCPIALATRSSACINLIPELVGKGCIIPTGNPVLLDAIINGASVDIVSCLIDAGAHVNQCSLTGTRAEATPLSAATWLKKLQIVQLLLGKGADPNGSLRLEPIQSLCPTPTLYKTFAPPLVYALLNGHGDDTRDIVQLLLESGADPDISSLEITLNAFPWLSPGEALKQPIYSWEGSLRHDLTGLLILYPLQAAAALGKIELIELLLQYKASLNTPYGTSALTIAVMQSNPEMVRLLLTYDADPNGLGAHEHCRSPLEAAVEKKNLDLIDLLLEAGADINRLSATYGGRTPLQRAAENGSERVIEHLLQHNASMLSPPAPIRGASVLCGFVRNKLHRYVLKALKAGANPNADASHSEHSPLLEAIAINDTISLNLLLHEDATIHEYHYCDNQFFDDEERILERQQEMSPIQWAAFMGRVEVAKILCEAGADVNQPPRNSDGDSALYLAVRRNNYAMAKFLITEGAEVDMYSTHGTPLVDAIKQSRVSMVELLLDSGSDPNQPSKLEFEEGIFTPLEAACYIGNISVLKTLLNGGADISHGSPIESLLRSALLYVEIGDSDERRELREELELLLEHGADVNGRDSDHDTALQAAIQGEFFDFAYRLLEAGACINAAASEGLRGRTALQAAASVGEVDLVELLLSRGADVNAPAAPDHGATALQAAAIKGYLRIAQLLLVHGADIDAEASIKKGRTAIDGAAEFGRIDMVKFLLDNYQGPKPISQMRDSAYGAARKENQWHVMELLDTYIHPSEA